MIGQFKNWFKRPLGSLPLRSRLVIGSLAIVFLAIAIMGLYLYYQARVTSNRLTSQLDRSILEQAENTLDSTADRHASTLTNFFRSLNTSILSLQETSQSLLSNQVTFGGGAYWDAVNMLFRNENGSWDNSNSEPGSVFIPAAVELTSAITSELNTMKQIDFIAPSILATNSDTIAVYFGATSGYTLYYPNVDLSAIVPVDFDVTGRPWYVEAAPEQNPNKEAVWSEPYLDAALNGIVITNSVPVYDELGKFRGVAAQDIQLTRMTEIVDEIQIGENGYAFLVDRDNRLIAMPEEAYQDLGLDSQSVPLGDVLSEENLGRSEPELLGVLEKLVPGENGRTRFDIAGAERFFIYRTIPGVDFKLLIVVPVQEMLATSLDAKQQIERETNNTIAVSIIIVLGIFILTAAITINFSNTLTAPILAVTRVAEELARGNLDARADISEQNEIGTLASTQNSMAAKLKESIGSLESRVAERTAELEIANQRNERRAKQFEAIALVAHAAASIQDEDTLLSRLPQVISSQFGFYHTGIFLVDDNREYAVLRAANSEGGKRMLERGHKLRIGQVGIVGYVTATGNPRIALDVGADAVFFDNPDLPDTRSELALPIRVGDEVIGALDVQSTEAGAFQQEDADVLATLANQIAIAIQNARSFETNQRLLNEAQKASASYLKESWKLLQSEQEQIGFIVSNDTLKPLTKAVTSPQIEKALAARETIAESGKTATLAVPIHLREEVIGVMNIHAPQEHEWDPDEVDIVEAVAERLSLALESALLLQTTRRRAEIERLTADISSRISSTTQFESILRTAAEELSRVLGGSDVLVQIQPEALESIPDTPMEPEPDLQSANPLPRMESQ